MRYLIAFITCWFTLGLTAQLSNGSIAPDFTATDIVGNEWNMYDLLDEGNTVILNFGATWSGPDWNYTQTGILQDLYSTFGPEGTGDLYVFFLESDDTTTAADLNGTGSATQGDWVSIINFPIIDNAGSVFFDSYSNTYYPTIYTVCPDGTLNPDSGEMEYTLVQSGQVSFEQHVQAAFIDCLNSNTIVLGCTDSVACNYNPDAVEDEGNCDYSCCPGPGCCNSGTYWDDVTQTCLLDITFSSWQPDSNADGNIGIEDLLDLLSVFGETWDSEDVIIGCTYPDALEYNSIATVDDGSCTFICDPVCFTNDNINSAVDLWISNESQATSFFGNISDWNVSCVTSMHFLFYGASSFNGDISSWDVASVTNMDRMFNGASSFNRNLSTWDVSNVTDVNQMFQDASSFNGDLSTWDVSSVTDLYSMFYGATTFNGDLSSWDVSNVTEMSQMFLGASSFNGDVSSWDVSSVTRMRFMFGEASSFNRDISSWDVSNVTEMSEIFTNASALSEDNQCLIHTSFSANENWPYDWSEFCLEPLTDDNIHEAVDLWLSDEASAEVTYGHISEWDVSNVTDMNNLFYNANFFNGDISAWDVSNVTDMNNMFNLANFFNGDISTWDISSVTNMEYMFSEAYTFSGDISSWDVSNVTDMSNMFNLATMFNSDLSSWDVSSVTDMSHMFRYIASFNQDISSWDVSSVTNMRLMFIGASSFNSDLSLWDVSSVTSLYGMFSSAASFNSDISSWDVSNVTDMGAMFQLNPFNGDISSWDVSSVTNMEHMFDSNAHYNGDLSSWDVSSVTNMRRIFYGATSFNSDISSWDVSSVTVMENMFENPAALSEENQCAIHTSFSSNENWPYDWSEFCPFVCGDLVSHEGYDYSSVQIGEQCWFSENCRYLPSVSPSSEGNETDPYYYVSGYQGTDVVDAQATDNYATYGALYNWPAVMTEVICPSGWHIPSEGEFTELTEFLGGEGVAGGKMKEVGYDHWNSPNTGATNSSGWTGLPGGERYTTGFPDMGNNGVWWSASESGSYSWFRALSDVNDDVFIGNDDRVNGFSARCVRD